MGTSFHSSVSTSGKERERRTKPISARHFCSRSPMSPSRKWTRKSEKRYNPYLWTDLSGKICDKTFISTLQKNYSFVRRLQNCVEWYGPFGPWHPSFNRISSCFLAINLILRIIISVHSKPKERTFVIYGASNLVQEL